MSGGATRIESGIEPRRGPRIDIFGVGFDPVDLDGAAARVVGLVEGARASLVVTANTEMVMTARRDAGLAALLAGAALVVADGVGVVWGSRYLGRPLPARVPGIELAERLLAEAARRRWRVYLLGGRPGVAEQAAARCIRNSRSPVLRTATSGRPRSPASSPRSATLRPCCCSRGSARPGRSGGSRGT
jgi:N-acetylglucosaminyldiphosphoundecaprenol N-acetyl-beta-D-mannosaminyltransferase